MLLTGSTGIEQGREAWIVDEASMLSARDAEQVLARAREAGARLVLVGDVDQLGSVEAGRSFGQLQDAGMPTFVLDQIVRQTNAHTREAVEAMLAGDAAAAFEALDKGGGAVVEQPDTDTRVAIIARDFARLSREDRAGTLVLDPTREGRQRLTDAIRAALVRDGTLGDEAVTATVLEPRGLSRAEAKRATSYTPGDIVTFRNGAKGKPRPGIGYRIEAVDAEAGTVRLVPPRGKTHDWQSARWGGDHAEAFAEVSQEFRTGDRVQFTRNNSRAPPQRRDRDGGRDRRPRIERHGREGGWRAPDAGFAPSCRPPRQAGVGADLHSAQGATTERVIAHLESFRANTVDTRAASVAISRARSGASIYTDSRARLLDVLGLRDGAQVGAIDETMRKDVSFEIGG